MGKCVLLTNNARKTDYPHVKGVNPSFYTLAHTVTGIKKLNIKAKSIVLRKKINQSAKVGN